jgi:membrane protein
MTTEPGQAPEGRGGFRGFAHRAFRESQELELMHRALGFAALGLVTLIPLLLVVSAADPVGGREFPSWLGAALGLSSSAAKDLGPVFGPPKKALSATTALGLAGLAAFGLSFVSAVQVGFERIWALPPARLMSVWRRVVWLAALIGFLFVAADTSMLPDDSWLRTVVQTLVATAGSTAFFWWTARFLLAGRVNWMPLLPGAMLTAAGLVGLRLFSAVVFSPLVVSSAIAYGAIGTVVVIVSWLIGIGFVLFGGGMLGRLLMENSADRVN